MASQATRSPAMPPQRVTRSTGTNSHPAAVPQQPALANIVNLPPPPTPTAPPAGAPRTSSQIDEPENAALQATGVETTSTVSMAKVTPIYKPKGKYVLVDIMGIGKSEYNRIIDDIHKNVERAGLDLKRTYRQQDCTRLANLFRLTRGQHPVLSKERFPCDWPQAELVKQYLSNVRKNRARQERATAASSGNGDGNTLGGLPTVD
ncbi:hypothetical protein BDN72DRAFT_903364 [Pluteus cervinus]|uniref:Uncharacterized protein n=1 Tax=Pluteus cervinus TaxID=181527 RepID=A0ACD3A9J6_9AGAR|nr:hypothetical protein BDN72DRAFT_903364 [Pluteus cervinus]